MPHLRSPLLRLVAHVFDAAFFAAAVVPAIAMSPPRTPAAACMRIVGGGHYWTVSKLPSNGHRHCEGAIQVVLSEYPGAVTRRTLVTDYQEFVYYSTTGGAFERAFSWQ